LAKSVKLVRDSSNKASKILKSVASFFFVLAAPPHQLRFLNLILFIS
jgi:hypothetical protein